ncbi:MAG: Glu/Leu/Phe/Val dehydrogenase [Gammaproteobacteria bacterium]|nr:Glu/Leu/Phe/Val dehydrogenase [Gammaproteobacteria bacterium]NIR83620.1 Glu/Leu/Phe/Val dehydrogenase [Gammaproteobacteria bacterium]NIR91593.1 Glu/Leu/Phe/Val dehydrogenase [Gammaproteobacteria bacterium]NIU04782.1 Glu/Leu/Phe/Val dehydrogenase [Gammaproteobacteria bacterium]NIV53132.1 amino acid dehydrogenase [Gammaproteobacteria bacterium]
MSVFNAPAFDDHEQVVFCHDGSAGLQAIIAIHNTNRGPSLGGCRMWAYASEQEALHDVLRLSKGMTYKSAMAHLDLGGGKSVIMGNPRQDKNERLLRALGRYVDTLGGRYIIAEDAGTSVEDMKAIGEATRHVVGIADKVTGEGGTRSGDPSPATAYGVFIGLRAAVKHRLGRDDLDGLKVAVQGVGHVGYKLAKQLHEAGARLWVSDIYDDEAQRAARDLGAAVVPPEHAYDQEVDVFAPCALGAVINDDTLPRMRAKVIAGAANNQLAEDRHGEELMRRNILYAPDYVINAGGLIDVAYEREPGGYDRDKMLRHIERIDDTLIEIFERADAERLPTSVVADKIAEERFKKPV